MVMFAEDINGGFLDAWRVRPMATIKVNKERAAL